MYTWLLSRMTVNVMRWVDGCGSHVDAWCRRFVTLVLTHSSTSCNGMKILVEKSGVVGKLVPGIQTPMKQGADLCKYQIYHIYIDQPPV